MTRTVSWATLDTSERMTIAQFARQHGHLRLGEIPVEAVTQCAGGGYHLCDFHARYHRCPNDHTHAPLGAR